MACPYLGAATSGSGTTTFTLAGSGKLTCPEHISRVDRGRAPSRSSISRAARSWQAGSTPRYLSGTAAPTVQGTLYNTGGTLAPGGIGTAGMTTITGNYVQSGGALAIDIGGTTQATGFPDRTVRLPTVSGSATVGGALNLALINGYVPPTGTNSPF